MKLQNPANAFVIIETDAGIKLAIDPWITNGIYDGSWHIYPPLEQKTIDLLRDVDHVLITHIHPDHFDVNALALLKPTAKIYVPDVYPNRNVCKRRMSADLFSRSMFVEKSTSIDGIDIHVIPPMNKLGHLSNELDVSQYEDLIAIDCGFVISSENTKIVLLADNFPFNSDTLDEGTKRLISNADLFAFAYNAMADDYPLSYDDFSDEEKRSKSLSRNNKRLDVLIKSESAFKPKLLMPYSSDFVIAGKRAKQFIDIHPQEFLSKDKFVSHHSSFFEADMICLAQGDELIIDDLSYCINTKKRTTNQQTMQEFVDTLSQENHPTSEVSWNLIFDAFKLASENMVARLKKMNVPSTWKLRLKCSDSPEQNMSLDLSTGCVTIDDDTTFNVVECTANSGYLYELLTFKSHWDNACISNNLSWKRNPDVYDVGLWKGLNFLHRAL